MDSIISGERGRGRRAIGVRVWIGLVLGLVGLIVLACAPAQTPGAAGASSGAKSGGVLKYAISNNPPSLDPIAGFQWSEFFPLVYNTLLQFNEDFEINPELALSWDVDDAGTTYTFKIREGVTFHNGDEMTAQSVKWSFERFKADGAGRALFGNVESVEASDATTVVVNLSQPDAGFLSTLAIYSTSILPQLEDHDFQSEPIGTGPFTFVSWVQNTSAKVNKNESYWEDGRPFLDSIEISIIPDGSARANALASGTVDVVARVPPADFERLSNQDGIVTLKIDSKSWYAIMPNAARAPFDDGRVRRALAMSYDRQAMVDTVVLGSGTPSTSFVIPQWHWAYADTKVYDVAADFEGAKALLQEAGFGDGITGTIIVTPNLHHTVNMGLVLQEQSQGAGFDLEVESMEFAA